MNPRVYFARYFELLKDYETNEDAYNALEEEHVKLYKKKKYATYELFKRMKTYHYKQGNY